MHGYRDTYNHRKANQFIWETVGQKPQGDNKNDYQNMHAFWRGMNAFRLSEYGEVFRVAEAVADDYYHWYAPEDKSRLGYMVDQRVLVLLNAGSDPYIFNHIDLPKGKWRLIANTQSIDHINGAKDDIKLPLYGGQEVDIAVKGTGLLIWVKD